MTTDPQVKLWTREEYHQLAESGWFIDQRVELIAGEILVMSPMNAAHAASLQLVAKQLGQAFGEGHCIRVQLPLSISPDSEPEPDVAVVPGSPRDYTSHPTTALLVVEISGSTLDFDRTTKRDLYARAGIEDYWIVNLLDRRVEVHRQCRGGQYLSVSACDPSSDLVPLASPHHPIRVADLLP